MKSCMIYKQAKNRNEAGSNLSLGTRLTVLSKRLGCKRCCDATPDWLEVCRLTIFASHCKRCFVFFQRSRVLVGSEGLKRTKWKDEYAQRRRLRRINSLSKVKFTRLERLYQTPKKSKASLSKVQVSKFILPIATSKLRFSKLQSSNSIF